jgi:serine/threonine protein kinase/tetratricopeptide (TPR) repeat protein
MDGLCPKCMGRIVFAGSAAEGTKAMIGPAETVPLESETGSGLEHPGNVIGRYKLLEKIGEGGFGLVFMAEQLEPVRRRVALKVVKAGMDTREVIARFEAERQALALMDHPNIAKILDAGVTGSIAKSESRDPKSEIHAGRPYFVMELVKGIPITEFCDQQKLPSDARLELFIKVCQAVQHAHQKGIIHRDLKPSNVLVTLHDGEPVPKVIDFGIAKALGPKLTDKTLFTGFAHLLGTPAYMSPEQAELSGLDVDTRSDIYSLGALLYELLTGVTPFAREALAQAALDEIRRLIRETEPLKPSTRLQTLGNQLTEVAKRRGAEPGALSRLVRGDLDWIVMKCLEKDRRRRYETANGLAMDLQRHLNSEPVVARPPTWLYRGQKFARKHRIGVSVAAGFALLLTAAAITSTTLALWANRERTLARASDAQSRAVLDFFREKILAAARPEGQEGGLGYNITLHAAVDAAEPEIAAAFTNQPLVEAAIRNTLGATYANLGDHSAAYRQHQRAWELFRARLGPDHPETLDAAHGIAANLHEMGDPASAVPLFADLVQRRQATQGTNDLETLRAMSACGSACRAAGQLPRALELLERAHAGLLARFGPAHADTLATRNYLAIAYRDADRPADALRLMEEVLVARRQNTNASPVELVVAMNNLARSYEKGGRLDDGAALAEEAVRIAETKLGTNNPATLIVLNTRGWLNFQRGRTAEALPQLEQALAATEAKQGLLHPDTAGSMNYLALARWITGHTNEGVRLFEEVLRIRRTVLETNHADTFSSMNDLGIIYRRMGRPADALPLHEEAWKGQREKLGPDHESTLIAMNSVILVYASLNRLDDALALFDQALKLRLAKGTAGDSDTHGTVQGLVAAGFRAGRFAEIESRLRPIIEAQRAAGPPAEIYLANTESLLGACLLGQKKFAAAETSLLAASEGFARQVATLPPAARPLMRDALQRLVQLYEAIDRPDEVAEARRRLAEFDNPK